MTLPQRESLAFFDFQALYARQLPRLQACLQYAYERSPFYREKFQQAGIKPKEIQSLADFAHLPFTTKAELRAGYPLELMAAPEEEVVRIHSSSGTTGKPVIIPYTRQDVEVWTEMMVRCLKMAGVKRHDRVQITPGYGLWTAGIGFQAGVERLGAMAVPTGPGNTPKQIEMMLDLKTTVLIGTSSYGLLLAEEVNKRGLRDKIALRIGIFGSERWSEKMRRFIAEGLGIETFDIYGLTEVYGPGIAIDCPYHLGLHYWSDHLFFEIIDPEKGTPLPPGEEGELVITTLTKEGLPLIRYRTHDLTRLLPFVCPCGSPFPLIDRIKGRTDDRIKIRGVNIYPGQLDEVLREVEGTGSEYQVILTREGVRDKMLIKIEGLPGYEPERVAESCRQAVKSRIGVTVEVEVVPLGSLPRSEKKTKRIFDYRED
ncbi:Phenylacetate--CoA ligase [Ammonifex degensii KC4]|uniref:Phenylacetate-coenzyme A ligase n=1 Tax=Ammonifex degensii (strain DSM 10501 / KC4) TaxID=429009 RepID=C9R9A7_AMMDK|nr:phenylacetate--CoA ligase [Ammonifex degensii]ACX52886.1 Phenylacetate--CoA ligase [Ammonifex degensii KC4]